MQIHGFALLMILGVSQRLFYHFYGLPAPSQRLSRVALICLNAAILGEMIGLVMHRLGGLAWIGLWYASVLVLAGTVAALVWSWRIFVTVAAACRHMDVNLETFLAALNDTRPRHEVLPAAIPQCCDSCARSDNHV